MYLNPTAGNGTISEMTMYCFNQWRFDISALEKTMGNIRPRFILPLSLVLVVGDLNILRILFNFQIKE